MTAISIGNDNTDRANYLGPGYTYVDTNNPADGTGHLTSLFIRVADDGNFYLGVFEQLAANVYRCRAVYTCGYLSVGLHEFTGVDLPVKTGDCLGYYSPDGDVDGSTTTGDPYRRLAGNQCVVDQYFASVSASTYTITIGGAGETQTLPAGEQDIRDVIDAVVADYVPTVNDWLYDNWEYLSGYNLVLGAYVKQILEGGTGSTGVTLAQLQTELAALETTILAAFSTQTAAIIGLYDALVLEHEATRTAIGVSEGNIDAAITVAKGVIQGDIAAIDAASTQDVLDARGYLDTEITNAENSINGHTDSQLGTVETSINNNTDFETGLVTAAVNALNNLSELAVSTLVDAAVVTIGGEVAETEQALTALINALDIPEPAQAYEGPGSVNWGTPTQFSTSETLLAASIGPGGVMDGCLLVVDSVPAGSYQQGGEGVTLHKYLGWAMFVDSNGNTDELQWLGANKRLFVPKHFKRPAGFIVSAKQGATMTATAFAFP